MRAARDSAGFAQSEEAKAERIAALRQAVNGLRSGLDGIGSECMAAGSGARLATGLPGAGFAGGALNEAVAAYGDRPAAFGFLFALMAAAMQEREGFAFFVAQRCALDFGMPYGHGLHRLGVAVDRLFLVETDTDTNALWAVEETLRSGARPAIVAAAIEGGLGLTQSRRLNLAAASHATPLVVLRGPKATETSAAATRWRIAPAPAALDRFGMFAGWRWHATLERCRNGPTGDWLIEWDPAALRFRTLEKQAAENEQKPTTALDHRLRVC
jgi:protein ImuA